MKKTSKKNSKKTNFTINIMIIILILIFTGILGYNKYADLQSEKRLEEERELQAQKNFQKSFEEQSIEEVKTIQNKIDIATWKEYETKWYGFKIKYPENWEDPSPKATGTNSKSEYKYELRMKDSAGKAYSGFDVVVYNVSKIKELSNTEEFPKKKELGDEQNNQCESIEGHLIETGDYTAEEIYIPATDDCYNSALFFSVTKGQYMYNIVPKLKDGIKLEGDPLKEISDNVPEFFVAISTFENVDIVRPKPKPKPKKPKIDAPHPVSYKKDKLGRKVCAKKNDKPAKSKKNKGKHLDMECCLDPDEYPNPHCYYDPKKYGKYLK